MPEIGATLREARMRARIDVSEVEAETKIRAKYLRAIENEEWDLLPGPTYVRSFLRTYAEFLGLDAKLLVEEYRLRHDRTPEHELPPIASPGLRDRGRRGRGGRERGRGGGDGGGPGRGTLLVLGLVAVVVIVSLVNFAGGGGGGSEPARESVTGSHHPASRHAAGAKGRPTATHTAPKRVGLRLVPTGLVYVCLVDAKQNARIDARNLQPGTPTPTYHSTSFRVLLGNARATLVIDGRRKTLQPSSTPLGFLITPHTFQQLPQSKWPKCGG